MNSIRPSIVLILWLLAMTARAAPLGDVGKGDGPDLVNSLPLPVPSSEAPNPSPADLDQEIIMWRLRAIVEELRRQGPPPIGCMEG